MGVHKTEAYPEIKRLLGIPEDEPIFILRAKDRASTSTLADYEWQAESKGATKEFLEQIAEVQHQFHSWQKDNQDKMKVPD